MQSDLELSVPEFFQGRVRYSYADTDTVPVHWSRLFRIYKAGFDALLTLLALPVIAIISILLLVLNPFFNPGPLFYRQERLGRHRKPFRMIKFRSMTAADESMRTAEDGVEHHRITPLGRFLRRSHIDEFPNFLNVLRGEMSVIGPRPDSQRHAEEFLETIPHYAYRYLVRPGITGLAQIESGYAEGTEATSRKAHYDQLYVETSCGRLDVWIAWRTLYIVASGAGAK
jgi:lipopolysaccharide/colanic/teichoic acid biosynthesis glycosyltransferase